MNSTFIFNKFIVYQVSVKCTYEFIYFKEKINFFKIIIIKINNKVLYIYISN